MKQPKLYLSTLIFCLFNIFIAKAELEIFFEVSNTSCVVSPDGSINITEIKGGEAPYEIFLNAVLVGVDSAIILDLFTGIYTVYVIDALGQYVETNIQVDFEEEPEYFITDEVKIQKGDSYKIDLEVFTAIDGITWFLAPAISDRNILQPIVSPEKDQIYRAEIVYESVCKAYVEVFIEVDSKRYVYFPTIFSPNNDGVNDYFCPSLSDQVHSIKRFVVADRWGKIVHNRRGEYKSANEVQWDAKDGYKFFKSGQYIYLCEIEFKDGQIIKYKGSVSIL